MPRRPRVVAVGAPHHVTQRGNYRQTVFHTDDDRLFYLDRLRRKAADYGLSILGWCLMPNHIHVVAVPSQPFSMAKAFGQTHHAYARRINGFRRRYGHFWQNRYYSCPLDRAHLIEALAYVDLNPVRARLAEQPEDYKWSSARAHLTRRDPHNLLDDFLWSDLDRGRDWADVLAARPAGPSFERKLDAALRHGRPLGKLAKAAGE